MLKLPDLLRIQDGLDFMLASGEIGLADYNGAWSRLLEMAGLTERCYAAAIDGRWSQPDRSLN